MTPYDAAHVDAFVSSVGEDVLPFLTLVAYGGTGLAPAECHRLFQRFCNTLTDWERCEATYRLRSAAEAQLLRMAHSFTATARAADDRADAAVALAEEVF